MNSDTPIFSTLPSLRPFLVGNARLKRTEQGARFVLDGATATRYSDSQLDDFHGLERGDYLWSPPLRLSLRARFSHDQGELRGTAGFGWWNSPFVGDQARQLEVGPQSLWFFFGSPPSNLAATAGWNGRGWFAQALAAPAVLPGWLLEWGMQAMQLPPVRWLARRAAGAATRAAEQPLHDVVLTEWHDYVLEWGVGSAAWYVDGHCVLRHDGPPSGPLALVFWIDNQWADLDGGWGLLAAPSPQWMEISDVSLEQAELL